MNSHQIREKFTRKIREALSKFLVRDVFYLPKLLLYYPTNSVNKNKNHFPQGRCIVPDTASDISSLLIWYILVISHSGDSYHDIIIIIHSKHFSVFDWLWSSQPPGGPYAPINVNPVGGGGGVRARGGDLMPETIPMSGFWSCEATQGSGHLTLTDRSLVFLVSIQKPLPSPFLEALSESHAVGERDEVFICFNRHNPILLTVI